MSGPLLLPYFYFMYNTSIFCRLPSSGTFTYAEIQKPLLTIREGNYQIAYITDIVNQLKNKKWPPDGYQCLNHTSTMLSGVQNHVLWSTWAWESMNNLPVGQLFGSHHHLGNFDECMTSPWSASQPQLRTQYCLANVNITVTEAVKRNVTRVDPFNSTLDYLQYHTRYSRGINTFVWGLCLPSSCSIESARVFATAMLERSPWNMTGMNSNLTIDQCQNPADRRNGKPYNPGFFVFIVFVTALVLISIISSLIINFKKIERLPDEMLWYFVRAFDIKENSKELLLYNKDKLASLYGVRFLSIMLIVMGHQLMYYNIGPISNGWKTDQELDSHMANLIIHDDLLVDTFFFMSGVLYMRAFMFFNRIPSVVGALTKRYLRLAPSLAMVIFYINTTLRYTGSGPLWPNYVKHETGYCLKNWWTNLLMLNNFVDPENMCYHNTWYIPCDFQMFTAVVLLAQLWAWKRRLRDVTMAILMILAIIIPGLVTYFYNLPPVPMMVYDTLVNSRNSRPLNIFYIRTYNRFGPYVVGMFVQRYLRSFEKYFTNSPKYQKVVAHFMAWAGLAQMLSVLLYGARLHREGWTRTESAVFAALNRSIWALGLGFLTLSCALADVRLIKPILTWYPWVPLSKLAYGIYITHGIIIYRNISVTRNLHHHDNGNIAIATMGVLVWSTLAAYLLWIFVEAPVSNIFKIMMSPRDMIKKMMDKNLTKGDIQLAMGEVTEISDSASKCNKSIQVDCLRPKHPAKHHQDPYTSSDSTS